MSGNKHVKPSRPSDSDLDHDPGIGQSPGLNRREGNDLVEGENSLEGDVMNDTTPQGGIDPDQRGRSHP
jgi:hypothetical protein